MTETTATERFVARMAHYRNLAALQRSPDWLARFVLRPDYEEPELPVDLKWLYNQGIRNYRSAVLWLRAWVSTGQPDLAIFIMGSRDLCWQISWLLEILEGRYAEDIEEGYAPNYYLNSRYGTSLNADMWSDAI